MKKTNYKIAFILIVLVFCGGLLSNHCALFQTKKEVEENQVPPPVEIPTLTSDSSIMEEIGMILKEYSGDGDELSIDSTETKSKKWVRFTYKLIQRRDKCKYTIVVRNVLYKGTMRYKLTFRRKAIKNKIKVEDKFIKYASDSPGDVVEKLRTLLE